MLFFSIIFGIIAFTHEVGHYIAARLMGVRVEIFSLGFGKRLFGKKLGGTDYRVSLIPFAGYVRLAGETERDPDNMKPDEFHAKNRGQKIFILFMGPAMNFVLAFLIYTVINLAGVEIAAYKTAPPQIGYVMEDSPAEKAGIQKGDIIRTMNGTSIENWEALETIINANPNEELPVEFERNGQLKKTILSLKSFAPYQIGDAGIIGDFKTRVQDVSIDSPAFHGGLKTGDIILAVNNEPVGYFEIAAVISQNPGNRLRFKVKRGEELLDLEIVPNKKGIIGVGMNLYSPIIKSHPGLFTAAKKGAGEVVTLVEFIFNAVRKKITGKTSPKSLSGPVEIAARSQRESGISSIFFLIAFISIQFGIVSLLPIYTLEGGLLMFYVIEFVRRKDFSDKTKLILANTGFVFLIIIALWVVLGDISRILPEGLHSLRPF